MERSEPRNTRVRVAEVLGALSLATDLGMSQPMGHVLRACYIAMRIAVQLRLSSDVRCTVYYTTLLMHSGCTASSSSLAAMLHGDEVEFARGLAFLDPSNLAQMLPFMARSMAAGASLPVRAQHMLAMLLGARRLQRDGMLATCEVGVRVAQRLGMSPEVESALSHLYERWDGQGPKQRRGSDIPLATRIVDPASMFEIYYGARGRAAAEDFVRSERGKSIDPAVAEVVLALSRDADFWQTLARDSLREVVLDLEPDGAYRFIDEERLDDVALAFADFVDIKAVMTLGHSKSTARLAEAMGRQLNLPPGEIRDLWRAALLHDLGHVAVGSNILDKPSGLSEAERERLRLHPYYTRRILAGVPGLREVAELAGQHHEWLNGQGYDRGLQAGALSLGARILALVDAFEDRTNHSGGPEAVEPADILRAMQPELGTRFDPACFDALAAVLKTNLPKATVQRLWPAELSDREVEVLRLLARGLTNRQMAQALTLSVKTVGHHVEHIYNKIGTSNRAATVYFALEHDLLP